MTNVLRSEIQELAATFAAAVVAAIRGANLDDILTLADGAPRRGPSGAGPSRPRKAASAVSAPQAAKTAARKSKARLRRRSPEDIAKALAKVVAVVKTKKGGLRAEQIRATLKMESKEMPRVLKEGLAKKVLKSKGQKRSTTYTAA